MKNKRKRTAVTAVLTYLLLTVGSWAFLGSYSNSYNKYCEKKIVPVSIDLRGDSAEVNIIDKSFRISEIPSESRIYCAMYFVLPDEIRLSAHLVLFADRL